MNKFTNLDFKALVFGAAIAAGCIILGWQVWDWFYPFAAIGLIYAGYQPSLKMGAFCGAFASTIIVLLTFEGYMGTFDGFFLTENGIIALTVLILVVGAFVGFVGAWARRSREKAKVEYEKKQKIGKNKNKKKNKK